MTANNEHIDFLTRGQMAEILGVSRWTIGELAKTEGFPAAIALGPRTLRYRKDEFYSWCEARRAAAKPARANYSPVKRDEPSRFRAIVVAA